MCPRPQRIHPRNATARWARLDPVGERTPPAWVVIRDVTLSPGTGSAPTPRVRKTSLAGRGSSPPQLNAAAAHATVAHPAVVAVPEAQELGCRTAQTGDEPGPCSDWSGWALLTRNDEFSRGLRPYLAGSRNAPGPLEVLVELLMEPRLQDLQQVLVLHVQPNRLVLQPAGRKGPGPADLVRLARQGALTLYMPSLRSYSSLSLTCR